jgi:ATP-binding cassette subfamily C protein
MPDESSAALDDPPVIFASEEAPPPAQTRIAEQQPVEPSLPEQAKTPGPGSTVVIEQPVPAPAATVRPAAVRRFWFVREAALPPTQRSRADHQAPPLHKRSGDHEFRDVLGRGLSRARRNLVTVGIFSVAVNLLVLAIPIYLFNMSDRVLTSRSTDTLMMLTMIVVIAIAAHVLMDMMRRIILMRVAVETEARLGGPVLSAAAKAAQGGSSREFQTLADLQHLRSSPVRCC